MADTTTDFRFCQQIYFVDYKTLAKKPLHLQHFYWLQIHFRFSVVCGTGFDNFTTSGLGVTTALTTCSNFPKSGLGAGGEGFIGEAFAFRSRHVFADSVEASTHTVFAERGQVLCAGLERELIDVAGEVFLAPVVEGADVGAFDNGPKALDAVCVNDTVNILPVGVLHRAMLKAFQAAITTMVIRVEARPLGNRLFDRFVEADAVGNRDNLSADFTIPADGPKHYRFANPTAPGVCALVGVLVVLFASDVGLVGLNRTSQQAIGLASLTDAMAEVPRALLGNAEFLAQLDRGNTLAGDRHKVHGVNPLGQGELAIFHDGAGADGELLAARLAGVELAAPDCPNGIVSAMVAGNALGPPGGGEVGAGGILCGEGFAEVECAGLLNRRFVAFHAPNLHPSGVCVKYIVPFKMDANAKELRR